MKCAAVLLQCFLQRTRFYDGVVFQTECLCFRGCRHATQPRRKWKVFGLKRDAKRVKNATQDVIRPSSSATPGEAGLTEAQGGGSCLASVTTTTAMYVTSISFFKASNSVVQNVINISIDIFCIEG